MKYLTIIGHIFSSQDGRRKYKLCKVLNEYDDVESANDDLVKLLTNR